MRIGIYARMLVQACPGKSVLNLTDHPHMTIAVDLGRKATYPTKKQTSNFRVTRWYFFPNFDRALCIKQTVKNLIKHCI